MGTSLSEGSCIADVSGFLGWGGGEVWPNMSKGSLEPDVLSVPTSISSDGRCQTSFSQGPS